MRLPGTHGHPDLHDLRRRLLELETPVLDTLANIDTSLGWDPAESGTTTVERVFANARRRSLSVVLFGNYSTGKTTLLDQLIGLPTVGSHKPELANKSLLPAGRWSDLLAWELAHPAQPPRTAPTTRAPVTAQVPLETTR